LAVVEVEGQSQTTRVPITAKKLTWTSMTALSL
jgi:hypothetical protein